MSGLNITMAGTVSEEQELQDIATEVNAIKKTTMDTINQIAGKAAIEIGRRLFRAKKLVGHGNWGTWLEENVSYSQRTASDLIAIFERFDKGQQLLFGQTLPDDLLESISPKKLKLLMSIKDDDKLVEFTQTHDVEEMSTRELKKALDEANGKLAEANVRAEKAEKLADERGTEANEKGKALNETYGEKLRAEQEVKSLQSQLSLMTKRAEEAEKGNEETGREAKEQIESLSAELEEMKRRLKEAEERKTVSEEVPAGENPEERRIGIFRANFETFQQSFNTMLKVTQEMSEGNREKFRMGLKTLAKNIYTSIDGNDA